MLLIVFSQTLRAETLYRFRRGGAYKRLSDEDRIKLEIVHRDFLLLWGALDRYVDHHDGRCPRTLRSLVPDYLLELPRDPFATEQTAKASLPRGFKPSINGYGYRYKPGTAGNRAWYLESVGLPKFPYFSSSARLGLYVYKGQWRNGENIVETSPKPMSQGNEYVSLSEQAVAVAKSWLALVDKGRYQEGWEAGAFYFRVMIPFERWRQVIDSSRKKNGKVILRKVKTTKRVTNLPGAPEGDYIVVTFKTDFWKKMDALETVVTTCDKDGVWRVAGYSID
jgi:hypothetical protein